MFTTAVMKGSQVLDKKIVSISSKRQVTIPQKFYTSLGFTDEAECIMRGNELIIRPARVNTGGEFAEQILADLITEGLSGNDLLVEFKKRQAEVRPAVERMITGAEAAARGKGEYYTYDEIFGEDDE